MKNVTLMSCRRLLAAAVLATAGALVPAAAQTGTPSVPGPAPDPTTVPIDGGAGLLLAGGVAYGLRQLRQRRKK